MIKEAPISEVVGFSSLRLRKYLIQINPTFLNKSFFIEKYVDLCHTQYFTGHGSAHGCSKDFLQEGATLPLLGFRPLHFENRRKSGK